MNIRKIRWHGKKNTAMIVLTATVLALALIGCSNKKKLQNTQETELNTARKLVVGHNSNYFPVIIAEVRGLFKEEFGDEVVVETPRFVNGPAQNEAISAGQLDLANMGDMPTIQIWANNVDIKVISYLWDSPKGYSLIANKASGITSLGDIKGKKVGIGLGTNNHKLILSYLDALGYQESDIEIINLKSAESIAALTSGVIDATTCDEPTLSTLLSRGDVIEVATSEGYDRVYSILYGRNEYMKKNPQIVARYLKVIDRANKWITQNAEEAVRLVANYMGSDEIDGTRKYYETKIWRVGADQALIDALDETIEFNYRLGVIPVRLEAKNLVDDTYVKLAGLQK
jgi:sulfonate transport system substrate-binding protein